MAAVSVKRSIVCCLVACGPLFCMCKIWSQVISYSSTFARQDFKSDPNLTTGVGLKLLYFMFNINCTKCKHQWATSSNVCLFGCLFASQIKTGLKKRSLSQDSDFSVAPSTNDRKIICVGRESNPGQLLGRQLCSPLYHRRFDEGPSVKNNIDF